MAGKEKVDPSKTYVLEETNITKNHSLQELAELATGKNAAGSPQSSILGQKQKFLSISIAGRSEVVGVLDQPNGSAKVIWHKRNAMPEEFVVTPTKGQSLRWEIEQALRQRLKT